MKDDLKQQPQQPFQQLRQDFSLFIGVCQIIGKPLEPWLRKPGTWGDRHVNHQMVMGWLFIPVFSSLMYPRESQTAVIWFWGLTLWLLLVHRIRGWWLRWRGYRPHSRYMGWSWMPGDEVNAKCRGEPLLALLSGLLLMHISKPLGMYLLLGGTALFISSRWQKAGDDAKLRQMHDVHIDEEWLMKRMQED